jgi:hypothetical protein
MRARGIRGPPRCIAGLCQDFLETLGQEFLTRITKFPLCDGRVNNVLVCGIFVG